MTTAPRITIEKFCPVCARKFPPSDKLTNCSQDGAELRPVTSDPLVGTVIADKFELLYVIGTGGCSTVYCAKHLSLDRRSAFKLLRTDLVSSAERIKRFEREAHLASSFNHPNVCSVYDCGILETGQPYLVMEYIDGRSLASMLQDGRFPVADIVPVIKQIVAGLKAAHQQGIVHRDLKPGNVMVVNSEEGMQVKIIDFGLAKVFGTTDGEALTATGNMIGTPAYMSPEQVRGSTLDVRSDIYSFGCLLYELLTGKLAFEGKTAFEAMQNHLVKEPPPLVNCGYVIPAPLAVLTLKCLQKDPARRYQSVDEIEEILERIEDNYEWKAENPSRFGHGARIAMILSAAAILCGLGVFAAFSLNNTPKTVAPTEPVSASRRASPHVFGFAGADKEKFDPEIVKLMEQFHQLEESGQLDAAGVVGKRALEKLLKAHKEYSPEMLLVSKELKRFYFANRRAPALPYIELEFEATKKLYGKSPEALWQAHKDAADAFVEAADEASARKHYEAAANIAEQQYGADSKECSEMIYQLARSEFRSNMMKESEKHLQKLLAVLPKNGDQFRLHVLNESFTIFVQMGKTAQAKAVVDEALKVMDDKTKSDVRVGIYRNAAYEADLRGDYKEALRRINEAMRESAKQTAGLPVLNAELMALKGSYLLKMKDFPQAESVLKDALHEIEISHHRAGSEYRYALVLYCKALRANGKGQQADAIERAGKVI
jgi:serine/threonine protein kinase